MLGTVKWFNDSKGYGFILGEDKKEYFVHWKSIVTVSDNQRRFLVQEEKVEFELIDTDRGVQAINVVRLTPSENY